MENSYLFTLFFIVLLQISFTSVGVFSLLGMPTGFYIYFGVISFVCLLLLYGFTHAVKANANAKSNSYICALLGTLLAIVTAALCVVAGSLHVLTLVLAFVSLVSSLRLAYVTYKKTKSYFL